MRLVWPLQWMIGYNSHTVFMCYPQTFKCLWISITFHVSSLNVSFYVVNRKDECPYLEEIVRSKLHKWVSNNFWPLSIHKSWMNQVTLSVLWTVYFLNISIDNILLLQIFLLLLTPEYCHFYDFSICFGGPASGYSNAEAFYIWLDI